MKIFALESSVMDHINKIHVHICTYMLLIKKIRLQTKKYKIVFIGELSLQASTEKCV